MQIILLEHVEKLGQMGDVVSVKPGFARNYLLPQGKALRANEENLRVFEARRAQLEEENRKRREQSEKLGKNIDGTSVVMIRQAGESGQLYGSVTARDIAEALSEAGAKVQRGQIVLSRQIKMLGLHDVSVRLHPEVSVDVTVNVARSQNEAEEQAKAGRTVSEEEQAAVAEAATEEVIAEVEQMEEQEADEPEAVEGEASETAEEPEKTS